MKMNNIMIIIEQIDDILKEAIESLDKDERVNGL